ncbi:MAG: helix-turn-helix domain-containing protein [Acidobacteria bacterium]|nr:helix-turn-helix domain-containing protein [Acidobacteriota bacterium]
MLLKVGNRGGERGESLYVGGSDLKAHAHGIGASRTGKSKLIETIVRQLIKERQGFCLLDPGGFLYQDLLQWLAYVKPERTQTTILDPSYQHRIVGFNPLHIPGDKTEEAIFAKVDRLIALTTKALGISDLTSAPRLERIMRCLYYVLIEQDLPLETLRYFLSPRHFRVRDSIIERVQSESIKDQWLMLTGRRPEAYLNLVESTANRLFKVLTSPYIKRLIGVPQNSINIPDLVARRSGILVNLQPTEYLSEDATRMVGTFLVSHIWETMRKRTRDDLRTAAKFYLIVDEFQSFSTPDFAQILDQGAKYGLHLLLFNQNLDQLDARVRTAMTACHTRFVFGGVTRSDAARMLEGAQAEFEELLESLGGVASLPPRYFFLKRPGKQLTLGFTPEVHEYRVPQLKIDAFLDRATAAFLSPAELDAAVESLLPKLPPEPAPEQGQRYADIGTVLTGRSDAPRAADRNDQNKRRPFTLSYERARGTRQHRELQRVIEGIASSYGFSTQIEKTVLDGAGAVDVSLERDRKKIACEVSVTTSDAWEVKNVLKCLKAGYDTVLVVASHPKRIPGITSKLKAAIPVIEQARIKVFTLADSLAYLRDVAVPKKEANGKLADARLTFEEAMEFFGVSRSTLSRWIQAGKIPCQRVGRKYRFDRDDLIAIGRFSLTGKRKPAVDLRPIKIEKPKPASKKTEDDRYRKMLNLD